MSNNELVLIEEGGDLSKVFEPKGIDDLLAKIRAEVNGFVPDLSTAKGRSEIASMAAKVARSKTFVDKAGLEYVTRLKALPKKIDEERKRWRDTCDQIRDEVRQPLTEWEEEQDQAKKFIDSIRTCQLLNSCNGANYIEILITNDYSWIPENLKKSAAETVAEAIPRLINHLLGLAAQENEDEARIEEARVAAEARREAEVQERIRRAEQAAKEKAERESRERELQAKLDAERAQKREQEAKERAERAEREAEERAKRAAEEAKEKAEREAADKQRRESEAAAVMAADLEHRGRVHAEAEAGLRMRGINALDAARIILMISEGKIKNVRIDY